MGTVGAGVFTGASVKCCLLSIGERVGTIMVGASVGI